MARPTVLIVDDDDSMRLLIRIALEIDKSFDIVGEAGDGPDALDQIERLQEHAQPDALVLDSRMPTMSGLDVARTLQAEHPDIGIVLCSAYLDDELVADAEGLGVTVLSKRLYERLPSALSAALSGAGPKSD